MNLPQEITDLLNILLIGIHERLGENLVGIYLRGSLALGDFIPDTSDIDLLAVTQQPVSPEQFTALAEMHAQFAILPDPYANRLEIAYVDRSTLWRFIPGQRHPTLGQGETLAWSEHRDNWILEGKCILDCLLQRHRPSLFPRRRKRLLAQRLPQGCQVELILLSLTGRQRKAESLA